MRKLVILILSMVKLNVATAQTIENWYMLNLGDKPVGYYKESAKKSETQVRTEVQFKLKISRLGSEVEMESKQAFLEDNQGSLKSIESELLFSEQLNTISAKIEPLKIKITSSTGGKDAINEIQYIGNLLGYEGLRMLTIRMLKKAGDIVSYKTFIPDYGMVVEGSRKLIDEESIEIGGKIIRAIKVEDRFKELPTVRLSWLDSEARLLKTSELSPFGQMTLVLTDAKSALTIASGKVELSDDQYSATVANSNVRLPQARKVESVTITIKHKIPEIGFPDFSGTYQTVLDKTKDQVTLRITRPEKGKLEEHLESQQQFLQSTAFFDTEDTLVIKTAKQIIGNETDRLRQVTMIRNWVHKNMKFNAGIALAPSSEVIRNMEGTCISFATITTTLCRAIGIPARYLMGYVYVDGVWGGHAWTEVFINDSWLPIDAAMVSPVAIADAARFYFARSSGVNDLGECFIGGSQLYANVEIDVLEYVLDGKTIIPKKELYSLTNTEYVNSGLGISMTRIKGFEFKDLDKVYPENILFSLENNSNGKSIRLYQEFFSPRSDVEIIMNKYCKESKIESKPIEISVKGNRAFKATTNERAVLAIINGIDVYVFVLESANAEKLLQTLLNGFKFTKYSPVSY